MVIGFCGTRSDEAQTMALQNPFLTFKGLDDQGVPLGRSTELAQLLRVTDNLGSLHLLLKGPRGVGKTTILRAFAGKANWSEEASDPRPMVFKVSLTSQDKAPQVVARLVFTMRKRRAGALSRSATQQGKKERFRQALAEAAQSMIKHGLVDGLGAGGAKAVLGNDPLDEANSLRDIDASVDFFCSSTTTLLRTVRATIEQWNQKNEGLQDVTGAVFIFDEADTATNFELAAFIKLSHEQFAATVDDELPVSFIVSGLDDVDTKLLQSHPSALRLLELIELEPFPTTSSAKPGLSALEFVRQFLAIEAHRAACSWGDPQTDLLVRLGEGIPFWVQRIAYYALASAQEAGATSKPAISIDHILDGYDRALKEVARAACQGAIATTQSSEARRLIACLAFSGQRELEKSELIRIAGLSDEKSAEPALRQVIDTEAVRSHRASVGTMIRFVTDGYQRWLNAELGALDIVDSMPSLTQALHELQHPVVFCGEHVPAFDGVKNLLNGVMDRLGLPPRSRNVQFREFSHEYLFSTLGVSPAIKSLGGGKVLRPLERAPLEPSQESSRDGQTAPSEANSSIAADLSLAELWENADIVAIPSYLLSEAYRTGVHNLDSLTRGLPEAESWKRYLEASTIGFFNSCVFNGSWLALPFTLIPKVFYTPTDAAPCSGILLETKPRSLPLAYVWSDYLQRMGKTSAFRFAPRHMDVSMSARDEDQQALRRALNEFKKIVDASNTSKADLVEHVSWDFPNEWKKARNGKGVLTLMGERRLSYYGWADWYVQLSADDLRSLKVTARPPQMANEAIGTLFAVDQDPRADAWVLVFPKNRLTSSARSARQTLSLFRVFMALMAPDWQTEFQENTGVSPFRAVLKQTKSWKKFPWLREISLDEIRLISKGDPLDHYRMQAKTALLSEYLDSGEPETVVTRYISRLASTTDR